MFALLRSNRDLRSLFISQVISLAGDWFAYVAFVGIVQDVSDSAILVTLVYVAQALPAFLVSPIAGPVVDRFDRRSIIRVVSVVQALAAAGLLFVDTVGMLWFGFLCLCVISALGSFVSPAAQAGLPSLTDGEQQLAKASLLFGSLWGAMLAVGAALGGLVASTFGRDTAFAANALSFVAAAVFVSLIRRPMQAARAAHPEGTARPRMRPLADMGEAFSYARRDHTVLSLLAAKSTFAMGAGIVGLLALLATDELGGGDGMTGVLLAARGVGVAVGPIIAARLLGPSLARLVYMCGAAGCVFGVCYLAMSVSPTIWFAAPLALVAHLGGGAQWTLSTYGLQRVVPDHVLGRILAGDFAIVTLIITLSNLAAGGLAGVTNVRVAIAVFALLGVVSGVAYVVLTRGVRSRLAAAEPATAAPVAP